MDHYTFLVVPNNNDDGKDARLTLSFFVGGINEMPLKRLKNSEYESIIKFQVEKNEN